MSENTEIKTDNNSSKPVNRDNPPRVNSGNSGSSAGGDYQPGMRRGGGRGRDDGKGGFVKRGSFFRAKKECYFSKNHIDFIDYKDVDLLKRFLGKNGRILPRRITGTKMIHQRMLANAVKRARFMGLLPFVGSIWSQEHYEQQNREYQERKRQSQLREEADSASVDKPNLDKQESPEAVATSEKSKEEVVTTDKNQEVAAVTTEENSKTTE